MMLGRGFMRLFALVRSYHFASYSFMAWNWYPPVKEEDKDLPPRLHGHADMDVITLLHQRPGWHCSSTSPIGNLTFAVFV